MISDEILSRVEKPARYIGSEINAVIKDAKNKIRFALCFPDVYEIGTSWLGTQILYYFLNERDDVYAERVYAPWPDMEKIMRETGEPLFALETGDPVGNFDIVGFTLQYEMSYTNIINMLNLANIPILASEREGKNFPVICAGGPCAYNPEPLADVFDFFYIGDGEVSLNKILDCYGDGFLEKISDVPGVYVPKLHGENNKIKKTRKIKKIKKIKKVIVENLNDVYFPAKQLTPLIESVHDRSVIEAFRGCIRGCRFCQAGYVYRPAREKSPEVLLRDADALLESSGCDEISIVSLSTGDYSQFGKLADSLLENYPNVNISLPSLRIDAFNLEITRRAARKKKAGLTFAPEAGTQRLRDVINKNLTEQDITEGVKLAAKGGYRRVKLYFMIGLPTETDEDVLGIAALANNLLKISKMDITVSVSCFVPKPFTPFQWEAQNSVEEFKRKQILIKRNINKKIKFDYHDAETSFIEAVLARGDRAVGKAIIKAWELGARFDGWSEKFNFATWLAAFRETGIDPDFYATRERDIDKALPWDFIDIGIKKDFFIRENILAKKAAVTQNCRENCADCGVCGEYGLSV